MLARIGENADLLPRTRSAMCPRSRASPESQCCIERPGCSCPLPTTPGAFPGSGPCRSGSSPGGIRSPSQIRSMDRVIYPHRASSIPYARLVSGGSGGSSDRAPASPTARFFPGPCVVPWMQIITGDRPAFRAASGTIRYPGTRSSGSLWNEMRQASNPPISAIRVRSGHSGTAPSGNGPIRSIRSLRRFVGQVPPKKKVRVVKSYRQILAGSNIMAQRPWVDPAKAGARGADMPGAGVLLYSAAFPRSCGMPGEGGAWGAVAVAALLGRPGQREDRKGDL